MERTAGTVERLTAGRAARGERRMSGRIYRFAFEWGLRHKRIAADAPKHRNVLPARSLARAAMAAAALLAGTLCASAQTSPAFSAARANAGTVGIVSGGADGTYIRIAADLANVLDSDDLRVLPMIGRGSLQNLRDVMFLKGVDIGIVQMDAREQLKSENRSEEHTSELQSRQYLVCRLLLEKK